MGGPNCVTMPPPELTPWPAVPTVPMLVTVTPVRLTLDGPAATPTPDVPQCPAGPRTSQHLLGQERAVALDFDIQIVLHRQGHGVLRRQIEIPGMQQRIQASGVRQVGGRNRPRSKGTGEPEQRPLGRVDSDRVLGPDGAAKAVARTMVDAKNAF